MFAASVADYWDTFVWKQLKLSVSEQTYSIRCDDKAVEGNYKFLWQFGTSANAVFSYAKPSPVKRDTEVLSPSGAAFIK